MKSNQAGQRKNQTGITDTAAILILVLACFAIIAPAASADVDVSHASQVTADTAFDASPSILKLDDDYWLIYAKSDTDPATRSEAYVPEEDHYTLYYKSDAQIDQLSNAEEQQIAITSTNRPQDNSQRVVSAVGFRQNIIAFVSGGLEGEDRSIYYYLYNTTAFTWTGPVLFLEDNEYYAEDNQTVPNGVGGNVNAVSDGNRVYVFWSDGDISKMILWDGSAYLINAIPISPGNMSIMLFPKAAINSNILYIAGYRDESFTQVDVYSTDLSYSPEIEHHSTAAKSYIGRDLEMSSNGTHLLIISSNEGADGRFLSLMTLPFGQTQWSEETRITDGKRDIDSDGAISEHEGWREGSAEAYFDSESGTSYLLFGSESEAYSSESDGEIYYVSMDWDSSRNHSQWIGNALSEADDLESIFVHGSVEESVAIEKPMQLFGINATLTAGEDLIIFEVMSDFVNITGFNLTSSQNGVVIGIGVNASTIEVHGNVISGNTDTGITHLGTGTLNATHNYWGAWDGPGREGPGGGDEVTAYIAFSPWYMDAALTSPAYTEMVSAHQELEFNLIKGFNDNPNSLLYDLELLRSWGELLINWSTDDPDSITTDGLIMPDFEDRDVSLGFTIRQPGSASLSGSADFTLASHGYSRQDALQEAANALSMQSLLLSNEDEYNVISDLNFTRRGAFGAAIIWSTNDTSSITSEGIVFRSEHDKDVLVRADFSLHGETYSNDMTLTVKGTDNSALLELSSAKRALYDSFGDLLNGNPGWRMLESLIYLPYEVEGHENVSLGWESDVVNMVSDETVTVVLNAENEFEYQIDSSSSIRRENYLPDAEDDYGSIIGVNASFSCGSCITADFSDARSEIMNDNDEFCGYDETIIRNIIHDGLDICVMDSMTGRTYEIMLKSFSEGACYDADGASCESSNGRTSFEIRPMLVRGEPVKNDTFRREGYLLADLEYGGEMMSLRVPVEAEMSDAAIVPEAGSFYFPEDRRTVLLDADSMESTSALIIGDGFESDESAYLNFWNMLEHDDRSLTFPRELLVDARNAEASVTFLEGTTLSGDENWNGLVMAPRMLDASSIGISNPIIRSVVSAVELGSLHELDSSIPMKIVMDDMGSYAVTLVEEGATSSILSGCASANDYSGLDGGSACYAKGGDDLVIWTYHLSTFAAVHLPSAPSQSIGRSFSRAKEAILVTCTPDWECTTWNSCKDGTQKLGCADTQKCGLPAPEVSTTRSCGPKKDNALEKEEQKIPSTAEKPALFDIIIDVLSPKVKDDELMFKVTLVNFGNARKIPVSMLLRVLDSSESAVYEEKLSAEVSTQLEFIHEMDVSALKNGNYKLAVDLYYEGQTEPAFSEEPFVKGGESLSVIGIIAAVALVAMMLAVRMSRSRKEVDQRKIDEQMALEMKRNIVKEQKRKGMYEEPRGPRIVKKCAPECDFVLSDGKRLSDIKMLYEALQTMDNKTFNYHVNSGRNDFANWIRQVFNEVTLADEIVIYCKKEEITAILADWLR